MKLAMVCLIPPFSVMMMIKCSWFYCTFGLWLMSQKLQSWSDLIWLPSSFQPEIANSTKKESFYAELQAGDNKTSKTFDVC